MPDQQDIRIEKLPPQSLEAEQACLGAMLLDEEAVVGVMELIDEACFYKDEHKKIFKAIIDLFNNRKPVDVVTVSEELKKRAQLQEVGGALYLTQLTESVPTSASAKFYARIVKEKFILRSLINNATHIIGMCYEQSDDTDSILDKSEKLIFEICDRRIESNYTHIKELIRENIELIDNLYRRQSHVTGVSTGFSRLDIYTAGLQAGDFIIVAGRPSMGKSAFVLNICENIASLNIPVAFFSLEMSKQQLVQRLLCSHARIDVQKVRSGYLSANDWPLLTQAAAELSEIPLYIDDSPALNIFELRAKARRLKANYDVQLVVVDYLQLIRSAARKENRQQEISEISRALKALAKELSVPLIAVSQLSRAVESRGDHRPQLSDLRESGAIEQDADVVIFLFREEYYKADTENKGIAEVIIAKQRNGPTGTLKLGFIKECMKFVNLARLEE